jgi:hypothetical protein
MQQIEGSVKCRACGVYAQASMKYVGVDVLTPVVIYLLGYNAVYSVEIQATFRRNMMPPSSGLKKNKPSKNPG